MDGVKHNAAPEEGRVTSVRHTRPTFTVSVVNYYYHCWPNLNYTAKKLLSNGTDGKTSYL